MDPMLQPKATVWNAIAGGPLAFPPLSLTPGPLAMSCIWGAGQPTAAVFS